MISPLFTLFISIWYITCISIIFYQGDNSYPQYIADDSPQYITRLLHIFYDLQRSPDGLCASTRPSTETGV